MQNRVLLIGGNFYPEPIGIGKYNGEMMEWLAQNGYDCTVITSYPYYPHWKVQQPYVKKSSWYRRELKYIKPLYEKSIEIYRCPQYVPANPTGAKRMLLDFSFFVTSMLIIIKLLFKKKYNIVISVAPSFEIGLLGVLYKRIKGCKFFYHIQDLQIDAARELEMVKSPALINFLFWIEKYILKQADVVSSVSEGMVEKVKMKCSKKIDLFPNWVDSKRIYPIADKDALKQEFDFKKSDKIILYSGAIGEKQGLENILLVAQSFRNNKYIKFVICGSGPYLNKLQDIKKDLALDNVIFMSTQPLEKFNRFLNMADLHLIIQKANASDLVMPSKLTSILAIGGVAIVTASPNSSLYQLITKHSVGIIAEPENLAALSAAIVTAIKSSNKDISDNACSYAKQFLSIGKIIGGYSYQMKDIPDTNLLESFKLQTNSQFVPVEG